MKILSQWSRWTLNKDLARDVWIEAALLLSDLIDKYGYFKKKWQIVKVWWEEYFYNTAKNIQEDTTISYKKQKRCIKTLEDKWYIKTQLMWVPAKLHFTICTNKIFQFVNSSIAQTAKLDVPKRQTNKNKEIIINNKNKEEEEEQQPTKKIWTYFFCSEKELESLNSRYWNVNVSSMIEDYNEYITNSKNWKNYKSPYLAVNKRLKRALDEWRIKRNERWSQPQKKISFEERAVKEKWIKNIKKLYNPYT